MDLTVKASESNHVINTYFIQMFLDRWAKRRFREAGIDGPVSMITGNLPISWKAAVMEKFRDG